MNFVKSRYTNVRIVIIIIIIKGTTADSPVV